MDVIHLARMRGYYREWKNAPRVEDDVLILNPFTALPFRDYAFLNRQWIADATYRCCIPSIGNQLHKAVARIRISFGPLVLEVAS
jgi:hypothetical protein